MHFLAFTDNFVNDLHCFVDQQNYRNTTAWSLSSYFFNNPHIICNIISYTFIQIVLVKK